MNKPKMTPIIFSQSKFHKKPVVTDASKQFGESLCDWLIDHYLIKTGNHYRILKEEMDCIKQGKIPD